MKKTICTLFTVSLALIMCGCSGSQANIEPVTKGISFNADIVYYNECYECAVTVFKDGSMAAETVLPESIAGLRILCSGDEMTAEYKGLSQTSKISSTPFGNVCSAVYGAFCDTWEEDTRIIADKENFYINGKTGGRDYKMTVAPTGLPLRLEIPDESFTVGIKDITVMK